MSRALTVLGRGLPGLEPDQCAGVCRRIKPPDRGSSFDLLQYESLKSFHLFGLCSNLVGKVARDDHNAVAHQDIAGVNRHAPAGDGQADIHRVMLGQVGWRRRFRGKDQHFERTCPACIPKTAIRDHAGNAAYLATGQQDRSCRSGRRVLAAIHDKDRAGWAFLYRETFGGGQARETRQVDPCQGAWGYTAAYMPGQP